MYLNKLTSYYDMQVRYNTYIYDVQPDLKFKKSFVQIIKCISWNIENEHFIFSIYKILVLSK